MKTIFFSGEDMFIFESDVITIKFNLNDMEYTSE